MTAHLECAPLLAPRADLWASVASQLDAPAPKAVPAWALLLRSHALRPLAVGATVLAVAGGLFLHSQQPAPVAMTSDSALIQLANTVGPRTTINRSVDDPMGDQMDNLFAAVDKATQTE